MIAAEAEDRDVDGAEDVAPDEAGGGLGPDEDTVVEVDSVSQGTITPTLARTRSARKKVATVADHGMVHYHHVLVLES